MALVKIQRSPSVTSSTQCSISDGENEQEDYEKHDKSECFFAGKGTALVLALKDIPQYITERRHSTDSSRSANSTMSSSSDIQQHLQSMFYLLKHKETLKMAVKLESQRPSRTRYLAIVSRSKSIASQCQMPMKKTRFVTTAQIANRNFEIEENDLTNSPNMCSFQDIKSRKDNFCRENNRISNEQRNFDCQINKINELNILYDKSDKANTSNIDFKDIEESCLLGIDCNEKTTIGLVLRILADTSIRLDGDGGFSISVYGKTHIFKPVSVQAMWSALQTLHKVSQKARENNYYPGGPSHDWVSYYESQIESDRSCLNEWNAMDAIESRRPPSPDAIRNKPTQREDTEKVIRMKLKEIMMSVDLDEVTAKDIRVRLEEHLDMDLDEYKSFIDEEMLTILGQMDAPTEIFEHVYLGSEWNASNLEELQKNGVRHILNVTREIDNFFPGMFDYFNVRVYDDEKTNLLKHWDNTFKYISRAKEEGSKVLVHCKMGVSRSASVVIAYAMKAYNWDFHHALQHVKEKRNCIKPNKNFLAQLETYRGMLDAMKNKEKLQRSKSETNLKNVKDARLIPGSEPTPLIQALNHSRKFGENYESKYNRKILRRSYSTSPKSIQNSIIVSKQHSQSLENLPPNVVDEQKNVRYPGSNGQNYSVTQNQILHIQKNSVSSVKSIVNELECCEKKKKEGEKSFNLYLELPSDESLILNEQQQISKNSIGKNVKNKEGNTSSKSFSSPMWASSAQIIHQSVNTSKISDKSINSSENRKMKDIFSSQLDHAFAYEEAKESGKSGFLAWTNTNVVDPQISHQNSCCSTGSAVVLGYPQGKREIVSRHSSWGSGDNKILASRNSSWGSYDTNRYPFSASFNNDAIVEGKIQNGADNVYMRRKILLHGKNEKSSCSNTVKITKQKLKDTAISKELCGEMSIDENHLTKQKYSNRCSSEEIILSVPFRNTHQHKILSASAPGAFFLSKNSDSTVHKQKFNCIYGNRLANISPDKIAGNVQSLKMSFEAKANSNVIGKKGRSLPSSPIAPHNEKILTQIITSVESKDLSVKGLVSKYQSTESRSMPSNSYRIRPRSFYESKITRQTDLDLNPKWISNNQEINVPKVSDFNRPPVPPSTLANITMTESIIQQNCIHRRVQQHGRTHPLAKLSVSKQRLNTAAYNTM